MASLLPVRSMGKLCARTTALFICDVQERFRPVLSRFNSAVVPTAQLLLSGALAMSIPVFVTEQYPKALGKTVAELSALIPAGVWVNPSPFQHHTAKPRARNPPRAATGAPVLVFEKTKFSMCTDVSSRAC